MKTRRIMTLAKKDLTEVFRNKAVWAPMLVVPLVFVVLLPIGFSMIGNLGRDSLTTSFNQMSSWMITMPASMQAVLSGKSPLQLMLVFLLGIFMAPMFLIMPMMFSSIIAAESFAGEKERKTLESLLYTPATDRELFLGKTLAAVIPAIVISWFSFLVYTLVVNLFTNGIMGKVWFPLEGWYPLVFLVTPAIAVLGTMGTVLVSARVNTFMEAYQSGASLVLLVLALVAGQMTGLLYLNLITAILVGLIVCIVDAILFQFCIRMFKRNRLIITV
jgi:ABC-2 type transport system permease protein